MILDVWARRWGIPTEAMHDLKQMLNMIDSRREKTGLSEAAVQTNVALEASKRGERVWRNNVGAGELQDGSFLRWGLCNDSKKLNDEIKSGDLIGCRPVLITAEMVGMTIGQFTSYECKNGNWRFTGTDREQAQLRWIELIISLGGHATFRSGTY